jgi:hypothetical protein
MMIDSIQSNRKITDDNGKVTSGFSNEVVVYDLNRSSFSELLRMEGRFTRKWKFGLDDSFQ